MTGHIHISSVSDEVLLYDDAPNTSEMTSICGPSQNGRCHPSNSSACQMEADLPVLFVMLVFSDSRPAEGLRHVDRACRQYQLLQHASSQTFDSGMPFAMLSLLVGGLSHSGDRLLANPARMLQQYHCHIQQIRDTWHHSQVFWQVVELMIAGRVMEIVGHGSCRSSWLKNGACMCSSRCEKQISSSQD